MSERISMMAGLLAMVLVLLGAVPMAAADEALDKAFDALKTYDWGQDRGTLQAIDNAVVASHGDEAARKDLETKLVAVLAGEAPRAAKDYACRQLSLIGSAACVPEVAKLLTNEELSHMGRYALERIPADEAVAAMRDALSKVKGKLKVGVINSLGARRDAASTDALKALLGDSDQQIAAAAAAALGDIGTPEAAKILGEFQGKAPEGLKLAAADAYLACAEQLLADGKKAEALAIYQSISKADLPKHVKLGAMRGLMSAMGQK